MEPIITEDSFFIRKEIARNNLKKIVRLSYIYMIAMIIIMALNSFFEYTTVKGLSAIYTLPLILLTIFNGVCIYLIKSIRVSITQSTIKKVESSVYIYIFVSFIGAAFVTLISMVYTNNSLFYTLIVFSSAAFFVVKPLLFIIPVIVSTTIVLMGMKFTNNPDLNLLLNGMYYFSLIVICYMLNHTYNNFFINNMRIKGELIKENLYRKQISKDLKDANRKLKLQSQLDSLTNLQNRMSFNSYVEALKKQSTFSGVRLTAMMIDIDCFKKYNDHYGHARGDEVIALVGGAINGIADQYGIFAARYGGEEFTLLIQNATSNKVNLVCNEMLQAVANKKIQHEFSDVDSIVTISIGAETDVAYSPQQVMNIIDEADKRLYEVKRNGKNGYQVNMN